MVNEVILAISLSNEPYAELTADDFREGVYKISENGCVYLGYYTDREDSIIIAHNTQLDKYFIDKVSDKFAIQLKEITKEEYDTILKNIQMKHNNNLLAISGKSGSGKDTVGKIIQFLTIPDRKGFIKTTEQVVFDLTKNDGYSAWAYSDYEIKKFADKLKDIVCILIGCNREQLEDREFKEKELGEEWWVWRVFGYQDEMLLFKTEKEALESSGGYYDPELIKLTPRKIMQLLGTEAGRDIIHPDLWILSLFTDYYGDVEIWKDIKGYEGKYQISSFGRVKGLDRKTVYGDESKGEYHTKKEAILKSTITGKYQMIKLEGNNSVTIHSLVARHFLEKPLDKNIVNHIDQNPLNNFYKNLEWTTQSENILSANRAGNGNIGVKQADAKLNDSDVHAIKTALAEGKLKQKDIAKKFSVSTTTICDIKKGRKWKRVGGEFAKIEPIVPISPPNWIITDMRFPNELEAVKKRGGICVRVNVSPESDRFTKGIHPSETALDHIEDWDYVIDNSGSLEDLVEEVRKMLMHFQIIKYYE